MQSATVLDSRVSLSRLPGNEEVSRIYEVIYFLKSCGLLKQGSLNIYSQKTLKDYLITTEAKPSRQSSIQWGNWGMSGNTKFLTAKTLEYHKTESGCSLSQILEKRPNQKYFLSEKAVEGFVRREQKNIEKGNGFKCNLINEKSSHTNTISARYGKDGAEALVVRPVLTPDRANKSQNGRRMKSNGEPMFTLTAQDRHGIMMIGNLGEVNTQSSRVYNSNGIAPTLDNCQGGNRQPKIIDGVKIRKLTPRECWRLQGFPDWAFERAASVCSDTQLYKQAGNSVTVNVVCEIAKRLGEENE
jgi:site-specific DNA-cytosine methylase